MPEGETLPKTGKSKDWLQYADRKLQEFRNYHSERNIIGQIKHPMPLGDDYSKLLSQNELSARKMGMELLRRETRAMTAGTSKVPGNVPQYKRGGLVRKTGQAELHKGEAVARKKPRKSSRSGRRS
jgi:hypothetical protein